MNRKTCRIAVLMDFAISFFQEEPKAGISRYAEEAGVDFAYFGLGMLRRDDPDDRARMGFFEFLTQGEFDGLLLVSSSLLNYGDDSIKSFLGRWKGRPVVSIGPSIAGEENVIADSRGGIAAVMRHLVRDHGIRDFAFVSGPATSAESALRLEAFRAALDEAGIARDPNREFEGSFLLPSGLAAVEELIGRRGLRPRAIVCANDFMAVGVRDALMSRGLSVPYDVVVTGFDDIAMSHSTSNRFTTVRQSFDKMAYLAAKRIHDLVLGRESERLVTVPTELRIRGSCGCFDFIRGESRAPAERIDATLEPIKAKVELVSSGGMPEEGFQALRRSWLDIVQSTIKSEQSTYKLEEALREARRAMPGYPGGKDADLVIHQLYSILMEENVQTVFAEYWRNFYSSFLIRLAVDRFQQEANKDLDWMTHPGLFADIARQCRAKSFHVLRFIDGADLSKGAEIVFSHDEGASTADWSPGPGAWMPPVRGSLVANMINSDEERFGYFLMDASASGNEVFETLRIRFDGIFHDMNVLRRIKQLNMSLVQEIGVRQESERMLKDALAQLERFAIKDQLTDLHNRRGFLSLAEQQLKFMRRQKNDSIILFADMDGLKAINDRWGHKEGDLAIQGAAKALKESLRDSDILARLGGDEFTALINNASPDAIELIKGRIRSNCERISLELGRPWRISLSVGFFHADCDGGQCVEDLLEKADAALYEEKRRNRPGRA